MTTLTPRAPLFRPYFGSARRIQDSRERSKTQKDGLELLEVAKGVFRVTVDMCALGMADGPCQH